MNHPQAQEWISYLYGEIASSRAAELQAHLQSCAACTTQIQQWKSTLGALDQWEASTPIRQPRRYGWLKWAALITLLLSNAFLLARFTAAKPPNLDSLQATLEAQLQKIETDLAASLREQQKVFFRQASEAILQTAQDDTQRLLTKFTSQLDQESLQDHEVILTLLRQFRADLHAEYATLRRELQTVALLTEASLQDAQQKLVLLAQFQQNPPTP